MRIVDRDLRHHILALRLLIALNLGTAILTFEEGKYLVACAAFIWVLSLCGMIAVEHSNQRTRNEIRQQAHNLYQLRRPHEETGEV
jgi:hypothetical protein